MLALALKGNTPQGFSSLRPFQNPRGARFKGMLLQYVLVWPEQARLARAQGDRTKETEQRFGKATQSIEELHGEVRQGRAMAAGISQGHAAPVSMLHKRAHLTSSAFTHVYTHAPMDACFVTQTHACVHPRTTHMHTALHWKVCVCACLQSRSEWLLLFMQAVL